MGEVQLLTVVDGLEGRFQECISEKNCTLIHYDILDDLKKHYDVIPNDVNNGTSKASIEAKYLALIESEQDPKYRKKYARL